MKVLSLVLMHGTVIGSQLLTELYVGSIYSLWAQWSLMRIMTRWIRRWWILLESQLLLISFICVSVTRRPAVLIFRIKCRSLPILGISFAVTEAMSLGKCPFIQFMLLLIKGFRSLFLGRWWKACEVSHILLWLALPLVGLRHCHLLGLHSLPI